MPKIVANSVSENRDFRQNAILQAAAELAQESGIESVTIGAVATRAGLARSSVYAYFSSSADLIADVLVDELIDFQLYLEARMAQTPIGSQYVRLWISTSLEYILDGRHSLARSAASVELPATRQAQIKSLHRQMMMPLAQSLTEVGVSNPVRVGRQISALLDVCVNQIEQGSDPDVEITALFDVFNRAFPELT
jgi:AcrR family transcriptional regulator